MKEQDKESNSGYRYNGEERDLHLRTYIEMQTMNSHLRDIKLIGVLIIATIAYPPIAWIFLVLSAIVTLAGFIGMPPKKTDEKPNANQAVDHYQKS
jgi:hypothetical protein